MPTSRSATLLRAVYPISSTELVLLASVPLTTAMENPRLYRSHQGLRVKSAKVDPDRPTRLVLRVSNMPSDQAVVDRLEVKGLRVARGAKFARAASPPFVLGIMNPSSLKVPYIEGAFPYRSRLIGVHVSVSCCTGCDGGVHDRALVVLNNHIGGPWTGIWVRTRQTIGAPYPRWQKVLCAGGVIAEQGGSTTVVDFGWMEIHKQFEEPHHAPPPLPLDTAELPTQKTTQLLLKGLDGSWVQFTDIQVKSAVFAEAKKQVREIPSLPRNTITFTDRSSGITTAYLYQPSGLKVRSGQKLGFLRGFVHAEKPGTFVILSDKEEDLQS